MDGDNKKIVFQLIHAGTDPVVLQTDNIKHGEHTVNLGVLPQHQNRCKFLQLYGHRFGANLH